MKGNDDDLVYRLDLSRLTDHVVIRGILFLVRIVCTTVKITQHKLPLEVTTNPSLFRCSMPDFEELNVFQKVYNGNFDSLHKNDTKRYRGYTCDRD